MPVDTLGHFSGNMHVDTLEHLKAACLWMPLRGEEPHLQNEREVLQKAPREVPPPSS